MHRMTRRLVGVAVCGTAVLSPLALAASTSLQELASKPQDYLGQEVEMEGYCVKNGRSGDVIGYECTSEDGVYVDADDIEPEAAKEKLAGDCAGGSCKATIQFVPHSYSISAAIEPGKTVTVFNADKAKVSF
jgi:hypothetical protein